MRRDPRIRFDPARRRLLKQLAGTTLAASAVPPLLALEAAEGERNRATTPPRPVREGRILELAQQFAATPEERVFALAADHVRSGTTHRELLAATVLAGVRHVRPWPPGTKFHVVLMGPSALDLAESVGGTDLWLPVFFNLHVLKASQARDISEGDWMLPPPPVPLAGDRDRVRDALIESLEGWDEAGADRAITAAVRLFEPSELFELLWPYGARDFVNIGHKMIHTTQIYRMLPMLPGEAREDALRSLVHGLLGGGPGESSAGFEASRVRVDTLPRQLAGDRNPEASLELMAALRTVSSERAVAIACEMLEDGVAPAAIWDGLRLIASEHLLRLKQSDARNAQLLGVHPLTIVNAFHVASELTSVETTRRLMLLQATAWMPMARDLLGKAKGLSMEAPGFDRLVRPTGVTPVSVAIEAADDDYLAAASLILGATRSPRTSEMFIDTCRHLVVRKAPEHHHHKYAAAAFEEFAKADPEIASYILAPCLSYLPTPGKSDSPVTERARAALGPALS